MTSTEQSVRPLRDVPPITIAVVWFDPTTVRVAAAGEIDGHSIGRIIEQAVETLDRDHQTCVELDLAGVDRISAAAAARLSSLRHRVAEGYQPEPGS